jgi:ABC-2 type transport system permease protein
MPIFDQGYQHWKGTRSGHAWRWLVIARHGARVQLRGRILRLLVLLAWMPAVALVVALALWGLVEQQSEGVLQLAKSLLPRDVLTDPRAYRGTIWTLAFSIFFKAEMFFIMLLAVVAGPGLISRDLRFNALPLYFSRPLTRLDYFMGKLGVIGALVALVAVGPALFAYVIGVCFSLDLGVVKDTYRVLLGALAYGVVITLSVGALMLALSSLSRRSLYVGIAWFGAWWISGAVGGLLTTIHRESIRMESFDREISAWLQENPPPAGVRMFRHFPETRWDPKTQQARLVGVEPEHEKEGERWYKSFNQARAQSFTKSRAEEGAQTRGDWRPMVSYTSNLERIGDQLLDVTGAWVQLGHAIEAARRVPPSVIGGIFGGGKLAKPEPINDRLYADQFVMQYPWEWSAGVLAALLGLSVWILTRRVKSLDRLK